MKRLFPAALVGLAALAGCARQHPAAVPGHRCHSATETEAGLLLLRCCAGRWLEWRKPLCTGVLSGWIEVHLRRDQNRVNGPFVACDYEGPEQFAFRRMLAFLDAATTGTTKLGR